MLLSAVRAPNSDGPAGLNLVGPGELVLGLQALALALEHQAAQVLLIRPGVGNLNVMSRSLWASLSREILSERYYATIF